MPRTNAQRVRQESLPILHHSKSYDPNQDVAAIHLMKKQIPWKLHNQQYPGQSYKPSNQWRFNGHTQPPG